MKSFSLISKIVLVAAVAVGTFSLSAPKAHAQSAYGYDYYNNYNSYNPLSYNPIPNILSWTPEAPCAYTDLATPTNYYNYSNYSYTYQPAYQYQYPTNNYPAPYTYPYNTNNQYQNTNNNSDYNIPNNTTPVTPTTPSQDNQTVW